MGTQYKNDSWILVTVVKFLQRAQYFPYWIMKLQFISSKRLHLEDAFFQSDLQ